MGRAREVTEVVSSCRGHGCLLTGDRRYGNDIEKIVVGPLRNVDAGKLAQCLLLGETLSARRAEPITTADMSAESTTTCLSSWRGSRFFRGRICGRAPAIPGTPAEGSVPCVVSSKLHGRCSCSVRWRRTSAEVVPGVVELVVAVPRSMPAVR